MSQYVQIYKSINKDITIGAYTLYELMIPLGAFVLTKFMNTGAITTIIIVVISIYYMTVMKELNETKIKGFFKNWMWWYGITSGDYKTFPKSYERELHK